MNDALRSCFSSLLLEEMGRFSQAASLCVCLPCLLYFTLLYGRVTLLYSTLLHDDRSCPLILLLLLLLPPLGVHGLQRGRRLDAPVLVVRGLLVVVVVVVVMH